MASFLTKFLRWASVIRAGKDVDQYPVQQVAYMGKVADCVMLFPYGMHANVDGDSLALMFAVEGSYENRAAMPTSMTNRTQLAAGEVMIYSPKTGSYLRFRANGDLDIVAANVNITGDVVITGNSITHNGTEIGETHVHSGVQSGGSNTGPVV